MITPTDWTRFKFEWLEQIMYADELTPATKVVAFCIVQHCNMSNESCWPSLRRPGEVAKVRKATVAWAVASLEENGYLTIDHGSHGRQSHHYTPVLKDSVVVQFRAGKRYENRTSRGALRHG
jgi:DNA-binding MarR family transcriptional regulator